MRGQRRVSTRVEPFLTMKQRLGAFSSCLDRAGLDSRRDTRGVLDVRAEEGGSETELGCVGELYTWAAIIRDVNSVRETAAGRRAIFCLNGARC
jgi:hypothetical protein